MIDLRYYQAEVTPALMTYFDKKPKGCPVVALPTGSGKSYCIADYIASSGERILVLSHVKEILEQNHDSIVKYTGMDIGLYSAGVGSRTIKHTTVAGIQSVYNKADLFQDFDKIIVDESHMINYDEESMYRKFINDLNIPVVGFTATPFRLGTGYIYGSSPDQMFDDLVIDYCTKDKFVELVDAGFLSPLVSESTNLDMDVEDVKMVGGDFSLKQLSEKFDRKAVTDAAIEEIMHKGSDRKQWMVFAIDIEHAEHITERLNQNGIRTAIVHSRMAEYGFCREKVIADIKRGEYHCVVNIDILTIGFDHPMVDLIALLRPTESPTLHGQILGRGCRIADNKTDCLILDFAGNVERLGPINDIHIKIKGKGKGGGEPIMKACPKCQMLCYASARKCDRCGFRFPREHGLSKTAAANKIIEDGKPAWLSVDSVDYHINVNTGRPDTLVVTYRCGKRKVKDHICLEHRGFAGDKARHWIRFRGGIPCKTVSEQMLSVGDLKTPVKIRVQKRGKYYIVSDSAF